MNIQHFFSDSEFKFEITVKALKNVWTFIRIITFQEQWGSHLLEARVVTKYISTNKTFFFFFSFFFQFNVPFKIISLIETSQSVGGAKREYPGKTT